jgi:hypothetical protein
LRLRTACVAAGVRLQAPLLALTAGWAEVNAPRRRPRDEFWARARLARARASRSHL